MNTKQPLEWRCEYIHEPSSGKEMKKEIGMLRVTETEPDNKKKAVSRGHLTMSRHRLRVLSQLDIAFLFILSKVIG